MTFQNALEFVNLQPTPKEPQKESNLHSPAPLKKICANYIISKKDLFFKDLLKTELPDDIIDEYPSLNVIPKRKFCREVKNILFKKKFDDDTEEHKFVKDILSSLALETPYKAVHKVIQDTEKIARKKYLSLFTQNFNALKKEIIKIMNEYIEDQKGFKLKVAALK